MINGMADDGFGRLVLVPREHMPADVLAAAADVTDGELSAFKSRPPCRVERHPSSGWYMVSNRDGNNCLRFKSTPGAVVTLSAAVAVMACERFNRKGETS